MTKQTSAWLSDLAQRTLGGTVTHLSAPGGRERQSLRVHFTDRTVIATKRASKVRAEAEAAFMSALNALGAPVPQVLAFEAGVLFQQDAGRNRLSFAMAHADDNLRQSLATAAIDSLEDIRSRITSKPAWARQLPRLGGRASWREDFLARHVFLSHTLKIPPPAVDPTALDLAFISTGQTFARWDARAGNAAVQPDGRVIWYDWEVFGRRDGIEDIAWLVADDFWRLPAAATDALLAAHPRLAPRRRGIALLAVLIIANRLALVEGALRTTGWIPEAEALRYDRIGANETILRRLCVTAKHHAARDPLTEPFVPWFDAALEALLAR